LALGWLLLRRAVIYPLAAGGAYGPAHLRGKAPPPQSMLLKGILTAIGFVFGVLGAALAAGDA
jgi:hypothetical protein